MFKISSLPYPSTVSYELGVLSDLQVGEVMYNGKDITLSWDCLDCMHTKVTIIKYLM